MKTREQVHDELEAIIKRVGWMVEAAFPRQDSDGPDFAYTVGLADKGLPELIVFGLDQRSAQVILNTIAARLIASDGRDPMPGTPLDYLIAEGNVMLIEADKRKASGYMFAAHNRNPEYRALQLVWPDENRNMPWEADYDHAQFDRFQPMLTQAVH